jgi:peptidoglycan/LPS O-acetylase OafA/YrhL
MQRIKELDSIRGLAALIIVIFHLWFPAVGVLGFAVDLFFVLSGYLITVIILDNALTEGFLFSFYARSSTTSGCRTLAY